MLSFFYELQACRKKMCENIFAPLVQVTCMNSPYPPIREVEKMALNTEIIWNEKNAHFFVERWANFEQLFEFLKLLKASL